jgi:hypothetical protein
MTNKPVEFRPVRKLGGLPMIAAIIGLLTWAAYAAVMIYGVDHYGEIQWVRLAYAFTSVQVAVFAGGAALWGVWTQQERAERAEAAAEAYREDATNGLALAKFLAAEESAIQPDEASEGRSSDAIAIVRRHAAQARSLFPGL